MITSLNEARAARDRDCSKWTVEDMLKAALREIQDGSINMTGATLSYLYEKDGKTCIGFFSAKLTHEEHIALLSFLKGDALERWAGR